MKEIIRLLDEATERAHNDAPEVTSGQTVHMLRKNGFSIISDNDLELLKEMLTRINIEV